MDEGRMRSVFMDQLAGCDWASGVEKDGLLTALAGYPALQQVVIQYLPDEERFSSVEAVMNLLPEQAWQDAQGGVWRGGEIGDIDGMHSNFGEGPVGRDTGV